MLIERLDEVTMLQGLWLSPMGEAAPHESPDEQDGVRF